MCVSLSGAFLSSGGNNSADIMPQTGAKRESRMRSRSGLDGAARTQGSSYGPETSSHRLRSHPP